MARNSNGRGRNNNPQGRNQYSSDWMSTVRERPMASAAAAAAAVGAGVFLWSKRNQISEQISNLSGQISDWAGTMQSGSSDGEFAPTGGPNDSAANQASGSMTDRSGRSPAGGASTAKARRSNGRATTQETTM